MSQLSAEALAAWLNPRSATWAKLFVERVADISEEVGFDKDTEPYLAAQKMANHHGVYPWNGPYGKGMDETRYKKAFIGLAKQHLAILKEVQEER